jgi:hypothetical protein
MSKKQMNSNALSLPTLAFNYLSNIFQQTRNRFFSSQICTKTKSQIKLHTITHTPILRSKLQDSNRRPSISRAAETTGSFLQATVKVTLETVDIFEMGKERKIKRNAQKISERGFLFFRGGFFCFLVLAEIYSIVSASSFQYR